MRVIDILAEDLVIPQLQSTTKLTYSVNLRNIWQPSGPTSTPKSSDGVA